MMDKDFIYVVCFYWQGDRWQEGTVPDYSVTEDYSYKKHLNRVGTVSRTLATQYITNLYRGVAQHIHIPFKFICFTNEEVEVDPNIEIRELPMITSIGVLPRMYMFSEKSGLFGHQVLSLDLDIIIVGDLDKIAGYEGLFCTRRSWMIKEHFQLDGDIMSFRAGQENEKRFWDPIVRNTTRIINLTCGRERSWVREVTGGIADTWDEVAPHQVVSYKKHVKGLSAPPKNATIISCHGHPRPHQIKEEWIQQYWMGNVPQLS